MRSVGGRPQRGSSAVSMLAALAIVAILLGLSYNVYRGVRQTAHVLEAQTRLRQVAAAMELYLWWKHMDASADTLGTIGRSDQVVTGARIRF